MYNAFHQLTNLESIMHATPELKQRVVTKVNETIAKIEQMYGTKFSKPVKISFDVNSAQLAGDARYSDFRVRINPHFLVKYPDETIDTTVPHEIAHLGCHQYYTLDNGIRIDGHGPEWKSMMVRLGADPSRCHTMEADEGVGRQKTKYGYKCSRCGDAVPVGPKIHANIKRGRTYWPRCCGRSASLVYVGVVGQVSHVRAKEITQELTPTKVQQPTIQQQPTVKVPPKTPNLNTKMGQCQALYAKHYLTSKMSRQQWIDIFVARCGCTPAGASTYYSTISKMYI